jgi:hypothetical protein
MLLESHETRTKEEGLNMKTTVLRIKNSARPLLPPLSLHEITNSEIKMMKLISLLGFNSKTALDYAEGWYAGDAARMERALHFELAKRMISTDSKTGRSQLNHLGAMTLVQRTHEGVGKKIPQADS